MVEGDVFAEEVQPAGGGAGAEGIGHGLLALLEVGGRDVEGGVQG